MGFGYFYDSARAGNPFFLQAPPVNLSSTFFYGDKGVSLQLSYGDFPATEVWEYRAGKAPKMLYNYEPSAAATPANLADPPQNRFIHL